ncbi:MAG: hypothetical protein ASARMPREDX12_001996 [Alectoria sarmentosa]|nr:MAG: hypothetical protein ASARMPREDX12_001996 [Alectoria sarmentosa]
MPTKMLDYACGPGIASQAMLPYVTEIRGIDVSDSMVDKFNAGARDAGRSEIQMHAVRGDLLAPAQGSLESQDFYGFDLAIMSMALHHIDNPEAMIAKLVERLKPGGTVLIIDWIPSKTAVFRSDGSPSHEYSHGFRMDSSHSDLGQHPSSHTVSFDGFTEKHMNDIFAKAKCSETDYVLATSPSEVPPDPSATAENWVVRDELVAIYKEAIARDLSPEFSFHFYPSPLLAPLMLTQNLSYPRGFGGDPDLLSALASFFNTYFRPAIQVQPSHIVLTAGASSCLDQLLYTICDAGDSVLVPAPYWNGFDFHLTLRTDVTILPVSCPSLSTTVSASILPALNTAYETAPDPARVKALVFTNPHNPLGQCYTKNVIKEVMRWCGRKEICFVGDEVYGLSEFRQRTGEEGFVSALNIAKELKERKSEDEIDDEPKAEEKENNNGQELPRTKPNAKKSDIDLSRVHIIWSLSKDLGCSGLRMAALISQANPPLLTGMRLLSTPLLSSSSMLLAAALFSSAKLPTIVKLNRVRLARANAIIEAQLRRWGVEFIEARAGCFVWARLLVRSGGTEGEVDAMGHELVKEKVSGRHAEPSFDWEMQQIGRLKDSGVLVSPGHAYHIGAWPREEGWVRITFAVEEDKLREGLGRIGSCLGLGKRKRDTEEDIGVIVD